MYREVISCEMETSGDREGMRGREETQLQHGKHERCTNRHDYLTANTTGENRSDTNTKPSGARNARARDEGSTNPILLWRLARPSPSAPQQRTAHSPSGPP
jgi:hypothetical protein